MFHACADRCECYERGVGLWADQCQREKRGRAGTGNGTASGPPRAWGRRQAGGSLAMALPLPLRLLNAGGQLLRAGGFAVLELEGGALCRQATRNTGGLEDFGDPAFRTPLGRLIDSLENEDRKSVV